MAEGLLQRSLHLPTNPIPFLWGEDTFSTRADIPSKKSNTAPYDNEQKRPTVITVESCTRSHTAGNQVAASNAVGNLSYDDICHMTFYYNLAMMVSLPTVFCPNLTLTLVPTGRKRSTLEPELDESHVFVDITIFVFAGVCHDAPSHGTGNLPCHDEDTVRCFDDDGGTFILNAGFGQPSLMKVSVVMFHQPYGAVHRNPVGVHVGQAHENGNH